MRRRATIRKNVGPARSPDLIDRSFRAEFERLERRRMLDAAPTPIVVGRVLSAPAGSATPGPSYFVGEVRGGRVSITYTVYNEQAEPESGVLLATTLAPGVALASSSLTPDSSGQDLAWSLGTIAAYDRASVSVTVSPAGPTTLALDEGARAFATLDGAAISASTPAAVLEPGDVDPGLIAPTPDADADDPYIQEEAAKLGYDPRRIFDFLQGDVTYNAYQGSVRGARGALWSDAGNSLDVASLGVALMRASGIPAQYEEATISKAEAQSLILSMFPALTQVVGSIPDGTTTADPADDPALLAMTEDHTWFRFNTGTGFQDADPLIPGATIGQAFATPTASFAAVPAALEATTEVQLVAEVTNTADALFGLSGQSRSVVLDQTFDDVQLVGHPLSFGQFVASAGATAVVVTNVTNTYTPYLDIGDEAFPTIDDQVVTGTPFQEVLSTFPNVSQVVTGLFLNVAQATPGSAAESHQETLYDAIGDSARNGGGPTNVSVDPTGAPALSPVDVTTLNVMPSLQSPTVATLQVAELNATKAAIDRLEAADGGTLTDSPQALSLTRRYSIEFTRLQAEDFLTVSDALTGQLADVSDVAGYFATPRLVVTSIRFTVSPDGTSGGASASTDLLDDSIQAIAAPGQAADAPRAFRLSRGFTDSSTEGAVGASAYPGGNSFSATDVFRAAEQQGVGFATLAQVNIAEVGSFGLSAEAVLRITRAVEFGDVVLVPVAPVAIDGELTSAWFETDPATGATDGVLEDGTHGDLAEFAGLLAAVGSLVAFIDVSAAALDVEFRINNAPDKKAAKDAGVGAARGVAAGVGAFAVGAAVDLQLPLAIGFLIVDLYVGLFAKTEIILAGAEGLDPPVPTFLSDLAIPPTTPTNVASSSITVGADRAAGSASGLLATTSIAASGSLGASWSSVSTGSFLVGSIRSASAVVKDANGAVVGSGDVAWSGDVDLAAAISGMVHYSVNGSGSLSFYGPAGTVLGVAGDWTGYAATATGSVSITLTAAGLMLDGVPLPAGTYSITTGSASLSGAGATSSPSFSGSVAIAASGAVVDLGAGSGPAQVGGVMLDDSEGASISGFSGSITVTATGQSTDSVNFVGSAAAALRLSTPSTTLSADQNTPVTFGSTIDTTLAGSYTITATAPEGWTVAVDAGGHVTVTPAPGTQSGTYPIDMIARSSTNPDLIAQSIVDVTVMPTTPGLTLSVVADPLLTVPFQGAEIPSAYRVTIRNNGPAADTYTLAFPPDLGDFEFEASLPSVTIPAGGTGIVGLYLVPMPGQSLPDPGTQVPFTVTATSTSNPSLTQSVDSTFTMPGVRGATVTPSTSSVATTPGVATTETLTIVNVGNVAETVHPVANLPAGLALTGLFDYTLDPGASALEQVTITPDPSVPLGTTLEATIATTFGAGLSQSIQLPIRVVVPGAEAIGSAAAIADQVGDTDLGADLAALGSAVTSLVQDPTSAVAHSQVIASINAVATLIGIDPAVAPIAPSLLADASTIAGAATAGAVDSALSALGDAISAIGTALLDERAHGVSISLVNASQEGQPTVPLTFEILLQNAGNQSTTYDLSISGLPAGVTATFNRSSIGLGPGQITTPGYQYTPLYVTLTSTSTTSLPAFTFTVTAVAEGAPEISRSTTGAFSARPEMVQVVSATTDPPFIASGGHVEVSATILDAVNRQELATVSYTLSNSTGQVVYYSGSVVATLDVLTTLTTVDLGQLVTVNYATGLPFPDGVYTINVGVGLGDGTAVAAMNAAGRLLIGLPVSATTTVTPASLPVGDGTVTNSVQVSLTPDIPSSLGLVGQVDPSGGVGSVAIDGSLAYSAGSSGINIFDVSDPTTPTLVGNFGSGDYPAGSAIFAQATGSELVVVANPASGSILLVYSLTNPLAPTLLGETTLGGDQAVEGFVIDGSDVDLYSHWVRYFLINNQIFQQHGEIITVDIGNPAAPSVSNIAYNQPPDAGSGYPDGDSNVFGELLAGPDTLLATSTTATMADVDGTGELLILDTTDHSAPALVSTLQIPGTGLLLGIAAESGDRAIVLASGSFVDGETDDDYTGRPTFGPSGDLQLITLDLSNPRAPVVLSTQDLGRLAREGYVSRLVAIGGDRYLVSSAGSTTDTPAMLLIDASGAGLANATYLKTPNFVYDFDVSGSHLYTSSASGLLVYDVGSPSYETPVTVSVEVPTGNGVSVVPGSFNVTPTSITPGSGFETITWVVDLDPNATTKTLSYQTAITGLAAGESRAVTEGTSIAFNSQGTPGSITLSPLSVAGEQFLGLAPTSVTTTPGQAATYELIVDDPTSSAITFNLSLQGLPSGWSTLPASVTVAAGGESDVNFSITPTAIAPAGTDAFTVVATAGGIFGTVDGALVVQGSPIEPSPQARGVVASVIVVQGVAGRGTSARYYVVVTNTGTVADTFALAAIGLQPGLAAVFGSTAVTVQPGAGNAVEIPLTATPGAGFPPGSYASFAVSATSTAVPAVSSSAAVPLTVAAEGVVVSIAPGPVAPGGLLHLVVTNTGIFPDTFALALGGPAALAASLAASSVSLGPGESGSITITTTAAALALPGALELIATATSTADPSVSGEATGSLTVAPARSFSASVDPPTRTLAGPGSAEATITVMNTGNAIDTYSATIVSTTGPVLASLIGLDGLPTRSIAAFLLPALSTGQVTLDATLTAPGSATITIAITSSDGSVREVSEMIGTPVVVPTAPTTTQLTVSPPASGSAGPTTLTAVVSAASGAPTGSVTFLVDGVAQAPVALASVGGVEEATLTIPSLSAGTHQFQADYAGSSGFASSVSAVVGLTITTVITPTPAASTTTLAISAPPAGSTGPVVLVAFVSAGRSTATGAVTFVVDGVARGTSNLAVVDGVDEATLTLASLPVGHHTIQAAYAGTPDFQSSVSAASGLDISNPITTTSPAETATRLAVSAPAAGSSGPITFKVVVSAKSGLPAGSVVFVVNGIISSPSALVAVGGSETASVTIASLPDGSYTVQAVYIGSTGFSASASSDVEFSITPPIPTTGPAAPSSVELTTNGPPAGTSGPVVLSAVVTAAGSTPAGSVVFVVDGVRSAPIALMLVGGRAVAVLSLDSLAPGPHTVQAIYGGDDDLAGDTSALLSLDVPPVATTPPAPAPVDGPRVLGVERFGYHRLPTSFVIAFGGALDPARAEDVSNYKLLGPNGRAIAIRSAVYDPAAGTVTLTPARSVDLHEIDRLTVVGVAPSGIADPSGNLLDGASIGEPSGDYSTALTAANLVIGASTPGGPARLARLEKTVAAIAHRQELQLAASSGRHHPAKAAPKPHPRAAVRTTHAARRK